jgi:hypothetical protein
MVARVAPTERILTALMGLVCLIFVGSLRDTRDGRLTRGPVQALPVPSDVVERQGRVTIAAVDADGKPVARVSARALWIEGDRAYLAAAATTDAAGSGVLANLPSGNFWILAEAEGRSRASTRVVLATGEAREVKLQLRPAEKLAVVLVDDAGAPIEDGWVTVTTGDPLPFVAHTAQKDGSLEVGRLGPPPWHVKAGATGFESVDQRVMKPSAEPLRIALRKLGYIDVVVVDPDGRPARGAMVVAVGSGLWPARSLLTDAEGRARVPDLPRGIYDFRATLGDRVAPAELGVSLERGKSKSITLTLGPGRTVAVRVTDGEGEGAPPIASAAVVLAEAGLSSFPLEAATDAHGVARLGPIAPGDAFVSARAEGFVPRSGIAVPPGASPSVQVALARGATLRGDVVDARGFPVAGASVEVVGTSASGEPIDETPERIAFRAAHFSWALAGPREIVRTGALGVMPGPVPPIPHGGSIPAGLLRPAAPVPTLAAGPRLSAPPPPEPWVTRADGTFRAFPIPPGRVRAIVHHPSYLEGASATVTLAPGAEGEVHVVVRGGGSLEGRLLDERRDPVAGARVDVVATRGGTEHTTTTADDGTFGFAAVPGEITLSVVRPDAMDDVALRTTLVVKEGERKEVELVLPAARDPMTVQVTDERGDPLDAAQVLVLSLSPEAPLRRTLFTDRDGTAVFKDAVGLPVRVQVSLRGRASALRQVDSAPAALHIELARGLSVTGRVTSRRGHDDVEGAEVVLYGVTGPEKGRTNREGTFRIDDAQPGTARLSVTHAGFVRAEKTVKIDPEGHPDRPIEVSPIDLEEGGSVEGEVVDVRGDPVVGARVARDRVPVYLPMGRLASGLVSTDRDGAFKLDDLPEGEVTLEAYAAELGRGRANVHVAAGRVTTRVRITLGPDSAPGEDSAAGGIAVTLDEHSPVITSVAEGSEAERAGLLRGDQIVAIDGRALKSVGDAKNRLLGPLDADVVLEIKRRDTTERLRVPRERVHR